MFVATGYHKDHRNVYLMLSKNISSTCKIRYVRYIALSYEGSHEGADGIAQHMRARPPFNLTLVLP